MTDSRQNSNTQPQKSATSRTKRILVAICGVLFALGIIAAGAHIILSGSSEEEATKLSYAPWPDLGEHYNLSYVNMLEDGVSHFNSFEISQGCIPFTGDFSADGEYDATVIGTGVWVRSYPRLNNRYKRCQVRNGDQITVLRSMGNTDGKTWCYAKINSGRRAGKEGFICTDYIIEQGRYDLLKRYVLDAECNVDLKSPTKYLRSIAAVMSKLDVNQETRNLSVMMLDEATFDQQTIVTFQLRDHNIADNGSLLAFVLFFDHNDDFVVLGIVPGNDINSILPNQNHSYDIYYY